MTAQPTYRLSVAQYHAMAERGILTENDPVELIRGLLVQQMPKNPPHRLATTLARDALAAVTPAGLHVQAQEPITLTDSEPEPDLAVVRGAPRDYPDRHPGPADVLLVVEVADTTLDYDRGDKKALYASERIPAYWIVNLVDNQLEVYTDPAGAGPQADYATRLDLGPADQAPVALAGQVVGSVPVADLLP